VITAGSDSADITAIDQGTKTITVIGDHTTTMGTGETLQISGSTGNDGSYTSTGATLSGGNTEVVVSEAIPDGTADGTLYTEAMLYIDADPLEVDYFHSNIRLPTRYNTITDKFELAHNNYQEFHEKGNQPVMVPRTVPTYMAPAPLSWDKQPPGTLMVQWAGYGTTKINLYYKHPVTGDWYTGSITCERDDERYSNPTPVLMWDITSGGSIAIFWYLLMADEYCLKWTAPSPVELT
jgi:hypothetical protein